MGNRSISIVVFLIGITASMANAEPSKTTADVSKQVMPTLNVQSETSSLIAIARKNDLQRSFVANEQIETYASADGTREFVRNGDVITIRSKIATLNGVPFYSDLTFNLKSQKVTYDKNLIESPVAAPVVVDVNKRTDPVKWLSVMQTMILYAEGISQENGIPVKARMEYPISVLKQTLGFKFQVETSSPVQIVASQFIDNIIQIRVIGQNAYLGYVYTFNPKKKLISISGYFGAVTYSHTKSAEYKQALQAMQKLVSDALVTVSQGEDRDRLTKLQRDLR